MSGPTQRTLLSIVPWPEEDQCVDLTAINIRWQFVSNGETDNTETYLRNVAQLDIFCVSFPPEAW